MEVYKLPIELAFIVFPFVAFILTIPFLIHQYRKYGAIPILKSIIFYSLILYLITAYFLVMLPLPSVESVSKLTTPRVQLTLFQFIKDIINVTNYKINSFESIIKLLTQPTMYTILFNLVLTLPFGVYLRYYFNKKWYHSLLYSFILSLFFELTQLSGLYGIYPRPYRLFDVDDLLINSLGGLIGHAITPLFMFFLPKREELEKKSYEKGKKVTLLRRIISFIIDIFFLSILCLTLKLLTYNTIMSEYYALISITIYYLLIPILTSGQTLGKKVVKLKIVTLDGCKATYQLFLRNLIFTYLTMYPFAWVNMLVNYTSEDVIKRLYIVLGIYQIINIIFYTVTLQKKEHLFLYEKITNTKNISIIEIKNINEDNSNCQNIERIEKKKTRSLKKQDNS